MKELGPAEFSAASGLAVIDRWRADLAAETGVRRRALDALASADHTCQRPPLARHMHLPGRRR